MRGPLRPIKPGETFYLCNREKIHYVGIVTTGDEPVHVYWFWNKWKNRRVYIARSQWEFEIDWEYMRKTKEPRKLIY